MRTCMQGWHICGLFEWPRCTCAALLLEMASGPLLACLKGADGTLKADSSSLLAVVLCDCMTLRSEIKISFSRATFRLIDDGSLSTITTISHLLCLFFPDQSCHDGGAVCVPQQPPARRRSGRGAWTRRCHQVRVAQEAGGVRQNVAQPLVRSARGSAALLQG